MTGISDFLQQHKQSHPLIVVFGPTASGKSSQAIQIATTIASLGLQPLIFSADARQIYTELTIGTNKILPSEMQEIPHFGIDIISPDTRFSVAQFQEYIHQHTFWQKFLAQKSTEYVPIICGGTGLFIDALIFKRHFLGNTPNLERRKELDNFRKKQGNRALWNMLFSMDPVYAKMLHPNNYTYVIRGIEIFESTGISKSSTFHTPQLLFPTMFFTPYVVDDRTTLYQHINQRVLSMIQQGMVEEVQMLLEKYDDTSPGFNTIGYKEVIALLRGNISTNQCIEAIQKNTRNYAKRQITWNKKYMSFL